MRGDHTIGGMPKAVYKSAKGMQDNGNDVKILAVANRSNQWKYRGIEVITVRAEQGHKQESTGKIILAVLTREYKIEKAIRKLHKKWPIDVIQYTGWFGIGALHHAGKIPAVMRMSSYTAVQLATTNA